MVTVYNRVPKPLGRFVILGTVAANSVGTAQLQSASVTLAKLAASALPTTTLKRGSGGGNYTTTSTTFVDIDATNLAFTVTVPTGNVLWILVSALVSNTTAADGVQVQLVDGATELNRSEQNNAPGNLAAGLEIQGRIVGDGAAHTVKLRYNAVTGGTATVFNGDVTVAPQMLFINAPSN